MAARLLLCMPLYTHVSTAWFINWMQMDKSAVVDYMATRKIYLASAMEQTFRGALESDTDWDRLVVMEADVMPRADALVRIANYPDHIDIVGAAYHQHPPPHHLVAYSQIDDTHYETLPWDRIDAMMAEPGLYPVDGVGFGLTSVHRRVLEKWDPDIPFFGGYVGQFELGHDLMFCRAAKRQSWSIHLDSGLPCGHLTELQVTYRDNQVVRANAELSTAPAVAEPGSLC